jgi:ATP-dependent helicase Lhr and Lhr-like helicase
MLPERLSSCHRLFPGCGFFRFFTARRMLEQFHPAVSSWFRRTFAAPTPCQRDAWPAIQAQRHTLIAAPTGSGKTLAAFLAAIDQLVRQGADEGLRDETHVLYISPLKALSNDIHRNLEQPLEGIRRQLLDLGAADVAVRAMVRTGDTPAATRAAMARKPPHILVTTPESFYILLTSESGRRMLTTVRTVIVDEIHAVVTSKRGAHLALSLERLEQLTPAKLTRIGLSATQRPIEEVARFLMGSGVDLSECAIVDSGQSRQLDLAIELPDSPLEALLSGQAAKEIYDKLTRLIEAHTTTLIFVNTRRMAERVARHLSERLGEEHVTSHHGSLAREQRLSAESRLKAGELRALVATASLELGIDIGEVDLVCQIGTTGSIATLMQRVGRSGHRLGALPKGRLFPCSRDDLIECIALIDAIGRGELDRLTIPEKPLDVLAQQMVAMVACEEWREDDLYACIRSAYPYRNLKRAEFDELVVMLAEGFSTRYGLRSAWLHRDVINRRLRARRGARLTAITCGGAIPDNADYRVILEPSGEFIGTVDEDFAIESLPGDIFQLGNTSWRVQRLEAGTLRVEDARNQPPNIPFWFGEAPGRTADLSEAVSRLRETVAERCGRQPDGIDQARRWLEKTLNISSDAAEQAVNYLAAAQTTLSAMPSHDTLVLERFFDETGGMQLILHAPFGSRLNRAWGLALRKRFCRSFNFELQAAATENAIILSLGTSQSFPLEEVARYLHSNSVRDILVQALLDAPMFTIRWRWNAACALAIRRFQSGRKTPPHLLRMQAEDLVTTIFPDQLACLENITGDRAIPDHPLVRQTIHDCLTEAMDIDRLVALLERIESGRMKVVARDLIEPSPLAAEILTARNYAFLDGAPAEERRTRAVTSRRWLDPTSASDLGRLDPAAIDRVRKEAWPEALTADECHDALNLLGFIDPDNDADAAWCVLFDGLVTQGRATRIALPDSRKTLWLAAERLPFFTALFPALCPDPPVVLPAPLAQRVWTRDDALTELLRARLNAAGPVTAQALAEKLSLERQAIEQTLGRLESEGFVLRGRFTPDANTEEWCERRLLARIHRYSMHARRKAVEAVTSAEFMRFLFRWQHLYPQHRLEGAEALKAILEQLEGFEVPAGAWERDLLAVRLKAYETDWLDALCLSGRLVWARLAPSPASQGPIRSSPIALLPRRALHTWRSDTVRPELSAHAARIAALLAKRGALFFDELKQAARMLDTQLETALAELVGKGLLTADSFMGLRALLVPEQKRRGRLKPLNTLEEAGRWALLPAPPELQDDCEAGDKRLEHIAKALLRRYGIVFRALLTRESAAAQWRELLPVYWRLEARGDIQGGRFVSGQYGEQFALPEAVEMLRLVRKQEQDETIVTLSAADPLNLVGIVTPGDKVSALAGNRILYEGGEPLAMQTGKETRFLREIADNRRWSIKTRLVRRYPALS